jgi:hypothetical protein
MGMVNARRSLSRNIVRWLPFCCKAQLESGYYAIVNRIHHRRFWRVDEERGVVWAYCIFDMSGAVPSVRLRMAR